MKILFTYLIALLLFIIPKNTKAADDYWGPTGHRVVGEIASNYISGKTKRHLKKLLNTESLAFVSTFGDEIKSDKRYNKFYTWHFINMPLDTDYDATKSNPEGDLVTGIAYCKSVIQDKNATDADKVFYLKLLVHLIGDLHQPMHVGLVEDKGGNDFKVQWFYKDTNLHTVWDRKMIEDYQMSYSELAHSSPYLTKAEIENLQKGTVIDWVNETHQLTKKVYVSAQQGENLSYRYSYEYFGTVRSQLQIAGIRLAKVLNDLF